jgi:acyl-coenzyme A synthetase/AMP-(fatty) acid ligase
MSKLLFNLAKIRTCYLASSFKCQRSLQSTLINESQLIEPNYKNFSYAHSVTNNLHLISDTVGDRLNVLNQLRPNEIGYKFCMTQTSIKFNELHQRVNEIAQNLLNMGFKKGDRLAIMLPNIPETVVSLLAAAQIGVISVIMNPAYQQVEIDYMLKKTQAKGLIFLDNLKVLNHYAILNRICPDLETSSKGELNLKNLPHLKHLIVVKNKLMKDTTEFKGAWLFEDIQKYILPNKSDLPHVDFDDPFIILFTVI